MLVLLFPIITVLVCLTATAALRKRTFFGGLVALQGAFLLVSFVVRPLILVTVEPMPQFGDSLADPRLAFIGYSEAFKEILTVALVGVSIFALTSLLLLRAERQVKHHKSPALKLEDGIALLAYGWLLRVTLLRYDSQIIETVSVVASIGAGVLILFHLVGSTRRIAVIIVVVLLSELCWSLLSTSKAPFYACGIWLFLAALKRGVPAKTMAGVCVAVVLRFARRFPGSSAHKSRGRYAQRFVDLCGELPR